MAKQTDDLEAVRLVTSALEGFSRDDQERIIRWAREKLGFAPTAANPTDPIRTQKFAPAQLSPPNEPADVIRPQAAKDLKTFVINKSPKNDIQFAATIAYFYRFEALLEQRRNEIDRVILQDACRLAGRERLKDPLKTLNNAKSQGLLDSGSEAGKFVINTVGENLVAMTLPNQSGSVSYQTKSTKPKKTTKSRVKKNR